MRGFTGIKEVDWKSDKKFPIYFAKLGYNWCFWRFFIS